MPSIHAADILPRRQNGVEFADADAERQLAGALDRVARPQEGFARVKHNPSRTVWRGDVDGVSLYVKHFHPRSLWGRLRRRLGFSDARRELRLSRRLRDAGVAAPRVLAAGREGQLEWVASETVTDAEPADAWHARQRAAGREGHKRIRRAIRALARTVARMHAAGVVHHDLHCGNLLVRESDGECTFVVMDLHRARRRSGRRARAANLAQLLHDRRDFTTRAERMRFLRAYLDAAGIGEQVRGWDMLVAELARRHTARQHAQRDRRIAGRNRYFAPVVLDRGWRGRVVLASKRHPVGSRAAQMTFTAEAWRAALRRPERLLKGPEVEVVKDSPTSRVVRRTLTVAGEDLDVYLKQSHRKRRGKILLDCFRRGRGVQAFRLGHMLLTRRIATALPLAGLERRRGPFLLDTISVTEAVHAPRLNRFLDTHLGDAAGSGAKLDGPQRYQLAQGVLWQLGRLVQGLHDHGFAHRDLKAPNMLVHWRRGELPEIVLVDLDGLRRTRLLTVRRRFQGLMRLNVSLLKCPVVNHAGRLRMLLGYLRRPGCGRINFKPYWRVLEAWSARKLNRQIRSRRRRQRALRRPVS
ncbi:MAG: lipopolysaccharide kinase InaA family protein [Planctomycetota bacterium]